jgi:hypothetical protein
MSTLVLLDHTTIIARCLARYLRQFDLTLNAAGTFDSTLEIHSVVEREVAITTVYIDRWIALREQGLANEQYRRSEQAKNDVIALFSRDTKSTRCMLRSFTPLSQTANMVDQCTRVINGLINYIALTYFERSDEMDNHAKTRVNHNIYMEKYLPYDPVDTFEFKGVNVHAPLYFNEEYVGRADWYYGLPYIDWYYRIFDHQTDGVTPCQA